MSDFGAIVYVRKEDGGPFEATEEALVETACNALQSEVDLNGSMGKPYLFNVGRTRRASDSVVTGVNLLLSDYWGDAKDFKWHGEVEEKDARKIAEALKAKLPDGYRVEGVFEWW